MKKIKNRKEYNKYLNIASKLMSKKLDSTGKKKLYDIVNLINNYENKLYPKSKPNLIDRIAFRWDQEAGNKPQGMIMAILGTIMVIFNIFFQDISLGDLGVILILSGLIYHNNRKWED